MKVNAMVKLYEVKFLKYDESIGGYIEVGNVYDSDTNKVLKKANEVLKEKYNDDENIIKTQCIISRVEKEVEI